MAEYIEREALKQNKVYSEERHEYVIPVAYIDWAPTADVVEVVRCKDCIGKSYWYKNDYGVTICGMSGLFVVEDKDFCSYGERRADND